MDVLVSGSTGLIGSAVVAELRSAGHRVGRLLRGHEVVGPDDATWDPPAGRLDPADLAGRDAFVHLSGQNIATRWNDEAQRRIRQSRVDSTRLLCEALGSLSPPPAVLACASAVGFYGNRGAEVLTEESDAGEGFLAEVCRDWEAAADPARQAGIRVVNLRFGLVLSPAGGGLKEMLKTFRLGLGGPLGGGGQYWSWIALPDAARAVAHVLASDSLAGPVNVATPEPLTNRQFTRVLAEALHRPAFVRTPAFVLRLALGEMADALLLASARMEPRKLQRSGFTCQWPDLRHALDHLLRVGEDG